MDTYSLVFLEPTSFLFICLNIDTTTMGRNNRRFWLQSREKDKYQIDTCMTWRLKSARVRQNHIVSFFINRTGKPCPDHLLICADLQGMPSTRNEPVACEKFELKLNQLSFCYHPGAKQHLVHMVV